MIKNLVTGASGFLGSHLAEALIERGEAVRALVRPTSKTEALQSLGVELVCGDLSDAQSLERAMQGMERVYHCAAMAADWGRREDFYASNVTGVRNLLEAAVKAGVGRFIHVSSTDVYGHPDYPADESTDYRVRGWYYGDTKIEGERLVWSYYQQRGLPITVVRPASIYGPRSISLVLDIVEMLKKGDMVFIGRRDKSAGLAYARNVTDLMILAADSNNSVGQAYNVTDGSNITWRQYISRLAEMAGTHSPTTEIPYRVAYLIGWVYEQIYRAAHKEGRPLLTRMTAELFGTDQGFPIEKARKELGYEPRVGFEEGMERVERWLREVKAI